MIKFMWGLWFFHWKNPNTQTNLIVVNFFGRKNPNTQKYLIVVNFSKILKKMQSVFNIWTVLLNSMLHPQLERQISWFGSDKDMLYTIFTGFSCWFQPCNSWNDPMAEIRGQPLLVHRGPSPPACFGSNDRGFEPFITAETGGRAWPKGALRVAAL